MAHTFERVAPVFPVRSVRAALRHYEQLGFTVNPYEEYAGDEPIYGFVESGGVNLHLALVPDFDPRASASACYIYVDDADALYATWSATGVDGRMIAPIDTAYGLREFAHIDPDGNLIRVGSELKKVESSTIQS